MQRDTTAATFLTHKLFTGSFETVYSDTQALPFPQSRDLPNAAVMRRFGVRQKEKEGEIH